MTRMSATKRQAAQNASGQIPMAFPFDSMATYNNFAWKAWTELNQSLLEEWADMQQQAGSFMAHRLEENLDRQRKLADCKSPAEAWEVNAGFAQKMLSDYSEAANKVAEIVGEMGSSCTRFGSSVMTPPESVEPVVGAKEPHEHAA